MRDFIGLVLTGVGAFFMQVGFAISKDKGKEIIIGVLKENFKKIFTK